MSVVRIGPHEHNHSSDHAEYEVLKIVTGIYIVYIIIMSGSFKSFIDMSIKSYQMGVNIHVYTRKLPSGRYMSVFV